MILVLAGTQDRQFTRLLALVDAAKQAGIIAEEVIAQSGHTSYQPLSKDFTLMPFVEKETYLQLLKDARLVVSHGGVASLAECLQAHKITIAVPRLKRFGEHQNDHQLEIVNKYAAEGHIIAYTHGEDFSTCLSKAASFVPTPYVSTSAAVLDAVRSYIEGSGS